MLIKIRDGQEHLLAITESLVPFPKTNCLSLATVCSAIAITLTGASRKTGGGGEGKQENKT